MADLDAQSITDQAVLIGLVTREQVRDAFEGAEDGSLEAISRSLLRRGFLTSWQLDKLLKGDPNGFFFGGCKVLFHLAEGTFARVYRGLRMPGGQPVAIKVLRRRFTTDPEAVKRFYQEAEAGTKLNHPNIVRIYDFGEQDKNYFMTMEYVEGMNLRNFLKLRHRLSATDALPLMIQLAEALNYSLELGITHRDIKATNILISNRAEGKLVDFGLATIETDEKTMQKAHGVRTVDYSALERTCGSPKGDPRSDIFFMGCVFYQMLTGAPPMPETEANDPLVKMLKRNINSIKPISDHSNAPPPGLSQVIERMMKVDLKKRYQTMEEVVADLKAYQASQEAPVSKGQRASLPQAKPESDPAPSRERVEVPQDEDDGESFLGGLFEVPAVVQPSVLCVEVQETIQDAFRKALSKTGYRVLLSRDAERAAERYLESPSDAVIFDMDGLEDGAFDAFLQMYEKASEDGQELAALVLFGPKQAALKRRLPEDDRLIALVKPIRMKDVQDAVTKLVPLRK